MLLSFPNASVGNQAYAFASRFLKRGLFQRLADINIRATDVKLQPVGGRAISPADRLKACSPV